jgi:hypothetical protein
MTEEEVAAAASEKRVVLKRTDDGMVLVVMPPVVLGISFMLLAGVHHPVTCEIVNAMAFHVKNKDVLETGIAGSNLLDLLRESISKRHKVKEFVESVVHQGSAEMFDGSYYMEIHPTELAGVSQVMAELRDAGLPEFKEALTVNAVIHLWADAARMITDAEMIALSGYKGSA